MNIENKIRKLSTDTIFNILTRPALELKIRNKRKPFSCIFIDIDDLKKLNNEFGYERVNNAIRYIFTRFNKIKKEIGHGIVIGRWFSGDEILILCKQEDYKCILLNLAKICDSKCGKYIDKPISFKYATFSNIKNLTDLKNKIMVIH